MHFDVDMQNVVSGAGHLFAYLHNSGEETRTIVVKIQTPDFQPQQNLKVFSHYQWNRAKHSLMWGQIFPCAQTQRMMYTM